MKKIFSPLILMLFVLNLSIFSFGQEDNLLSKKIKIKINQGTFVYVLATLAQDHNIPIGLEKSIAHKDLAKINISAENIALEDVLNLLIEQESSYQWQLVDGVINFSPVEHRSEFTTMFLNQSIENFTYDDEMDKFKIKYKILNLPEINYLMNLKKVSLDLFSDDVNGRITCSEDKIAFDISNSNLRVILNKIIKDSKYNTWVIEMTGKNRDKLFLSF